MIKFRNEADFIKHFFDYYFYQLRVGLIMVIKGSPHLKFGVGKSYSAIRIAEILDKDFRQGTKGMNKIVFTPQDFVKAMEIVEKKGRIGQVVVVDEAGILVNAKQWMSMVNKAIRDAIITWRELRSLAIFITPTLAAIDKDIRTFTNILGECNKVITEHEELSVELWLYRLYWSEFKQQFYRYTPTAFNNRGEIVKINPIIMSIPENKELLDAYEEKMHEFKKKIRASIKGLEDKGVMTPDEIINDILENKELITYSNRLKRYYVSVDDVRYKYGITYSMARIIAHRVNDKLRTMKVNENENI